MPAPDPTLICRFVHVDNLEVILRREGLHAPNRTPADGVIYKTIHDVDVQQKRASQPITCGPRGVIHDYVPFYFGMLSPMMLKLKSGQVDGYTEGQAPLVYLVTTAQVIAHSGVGFVFSDGHGLAAFTSWYDDIGQLGQVDWDMVYKKYWADNINDMDRQRRKQAEFLVHEQCGWSLIQEIVVMNADMKAKVEQLLGRFDVKLHRSVVERRGWYY